MTYKDAKQDAKLQIETCLNKWIKIQCKLISTITSHSHIRDIKHKSKLSNSKCKWTSQTSHG